MIHDYIAAHYIVKISSVYASINAMVNALDINIFLLL